MSELPVYKKKMLAYSSGEMAASNACEEGERKEASQRLLFKSVLLLAFMGISLSLTIFLAYAENTHSLSSRLATSLSSLLDYKGKQNFSNYQYYYPSQNEIAISEEAPLFRCNQGTFTNVVKPGDDCTMVKAPQAMYSHRDKFITPAFEEMH